MEKKKIVLDIPLANLMLGYDYIPAPPPVDNIEKLDETVTALYTSIFTEEDGSLAIEGFLKADNVTANSFDLLVKFPAADGISHMQLQVNDPQIGHHTFRNDINLKNGIYRLSNLITGGTYYFTAYWTENNEWKSMSLSVATALPEEVLTLTESAHFNISLEKLDSELFSDNSYKSWRDNLDTYYDDLADLTGYKPYNGGKLNIKSTRKEYFYWSESANPISWARKYIPGQIYKTNTKGDWSFGIIHEISHDFDSYKWNFDTEFFANFKLYYSVGKNNAVINVGNQYYTGSMLRDYFKSGGSTKMESLCYENSIEQGIYSYDGLTYTFIKIQDQIGWEPFRQTFRYFNTLENKDVPTTNLSKMNLFISELSNFSGIDVFSLLSRREKQVYGVRFGGKLEYVNE